MISVTQALESEFSLSEPYCFSDSTVAVYWIKGSAKVWKPFVQNRVSEIRALIAPHSWNHCAGRDNPADIPSRGHTAEQLSNSHLWMNGPDWLKVTDFNYTELEMPEACQTELRKEQQSKTHGLLTISGTTASIGKVMEIEGFSTFHRLVSVTAKVLRFCRLLLHSVQRAMTMSTTVELSEAEALWVIESQHVLVQHKNFNQWKRQFDLFRDERGIWRCRGRIHNADLSYSAKHPILLDKSHYLSTLLVRRAHKRLFHGGVKSTLTELRSQFWLVRGRSFVKQVLAKCIICRRFEGKPYCAPNPPPLPPFRVDEAPPFTHAGVDFAGPLFLAGKDKEKGKVWICLLTCCSTRAVHLDVVQDLSAPTFLRCLKRFTARRGTPSQFVSDNGKTFKATARILRSIFSDASVQQYLSDSGIKWVFNLPKAPWWGGVFERLIRSTKRCLRKILGQSRLTYDELLTATVEVEGILNSRPLTYVSMEDIDEPLTPSHLLTGRRILSLPDHLSRHNDEESQFESGPNVLTRRMKYLNRLLQQFWSRWRREYLLELRESHRHHRGSEDTTPIAVGDVVVVHSKEQPRGFWKLGRVKEVLVGRDGKVRGAVVKVASQGRQSTTLYRPIQLLYPLEVTENQNNPEQSLNPCMEVNNTSPDEQELPPRERSLNPRMEVNNTSPDELELPPRRSKRRAALEARDKIVAQTLDD